MTGYPQYPQRAMVPAGNPRPSGPALGFGIASLVLGVLAVLTICIPVVPLLIAGLGMVLALVGMACSARRGGAAMPIIGAIVCAVPIVLVIGTYAGICTLSFFGRPGTPTGPGPTTTSVPSSTAPATTAPSSQATGEPPTGSLDALFAEIVRTDLQTMGQWEPRTAKPPMDFIADVRERAEFRQANLSGAGIGERIICLNYSPGQKPSNQTFYIAAKVDAGWKLIGKMEGEPEVKDGWGQYGVKPVVTSFYNGGGEYTFTRYEFDGRQYAAVSSETIRPGEEESGPAAER